MNGDEFSRIRKRSRSEAHQTLFDEYYNYVGTIVINHLRNVGTQEDIEECISDVFAKVFFALEEQEVTGDMKKFIATISKRTSIDHFRSLSPKAERTISLDDETFPSISSDDDLEAEHEKNELQNCRGSGPPSGGSDERLLRIWRFLARYLQRPCSGESVLPRRLRRHVV